ncbi:MAG: nucleotidyltransferase domain-containing protein [Candidatus Omnitrophota bacterium]
MSDNLRKEKLEAEFKRIVEILIHKYSPEELIVFGSFARGTIGENSDIDLVIIKKTHKKFTERIGEVIELCHPTMAVDFIVYTPEEFARLETKEDFIKKEVVEKGKVIYVKQ